MIRSIFGLTMVIVAFLLWSSGCVVVTGGGGGATVDDGGGSGDGTDDGAGNDNGNTGGSDDGGATDDDSDQLPQAIFLDGIWDDNGRRVTVTVTQDVVEAYYVEERYCDRESGPTDEPGDNTDSTTVDFGGTLSNGEVVLPGDTITGTSPEGGIITCRWGYEDGNDGFVFADFTLTVVDENTMSGEYRYDSDGDGEPDATGSLFLTRVQ